MRIDKEINKKINELYNSPTFRMSLCGKELFHSNFWAWLLEYGEKNRFEGKNPFAKMFFGYKGSLLRVEREKEHRDISAYFKNDKGVEKVFVIENKLKSVAKIDQLKGYEDKLGKKFKVGILTGITDDLNLKGTRWRFISYKEIGNKLKKAIKNIPEEDKKLIERYANDILKLSEIFDSMLKNNTDLPTSENENCKALDKIKFADVYIKKQYDAFKNNIENDNKYSDLCSRAESLGLMLCVNTGFSNKNGTIDIALVSNSEMRIGIQIQGDKYRRFAESPEKNRFQSVYEKYCGIWFQDYNNEKFIFNRTTSMKKKYGCFNPKSFVHQYYNLDKNELNFECLKEYIFKDIEYLIEKIKNKESDI